MKSSSYIDEKGHLVIEDKEYQDPKEEIKALKSELAELIAERDDLNHNGRPKVEAIYLYEFGDLKLELFHAEIHVIRLKRIVHYIQTEVMNGRKYDRDEIEKRADSEISGYRMNGDILSGKVFAAKENIESNKFSLNQNYISEYRKIIECLCPDSSIEANPERKALWHRAQSAFVQHDLEDLREVLSIAKSINIDLSDNEDFLLARIVELKSTINKVKNQIDMIRSEFPLVFAHLIDDKNWVESEKIKIRESITEFNSYRNNLESYLQEILNGDL